MADVKTLSTKEVSAITGATWRQLQIWDEKGLIHLAARNPNRQWGVIAVEEAWILASLRRRGAPLYYAEAAMKSVMRGRGRYAAIECAYAKDSWSSRGRITDPIRVCVDDSLGRIALVAEQWDVPAFLLDRKGGCCQ